MRTPVIAAAVLALLASGCSKNDSPTAPDQAAGATPAARLFVNPASGSDANPGTDTAPLKTIHKALAVAVSGQHVALQAGTYDVGAGQTFPDTIPGGVTVEAVSAGLAVLVGSTGRSAFVGTGNDTLRYLTLQNFAAALTASSGNHQAFNTNASGVTWFFQLSNNALATATNCTLTGSGMVSATDIAQLTLNACSMSSQPLEGFVSLIKAAKLFMNNTTMSDAKVTGIDIREIAEATLNGCTITRVSLQGAGGSASIDMSGSSHVTMRSTYVTGSYGPVVLLRDPDVAFTARSCYFSGNGTGPGYPSFWQYGGSIDIDSCSIYGGAEGFSLQGGYVRLNHSTIQGVVGYGISASSGTSLFMRNSGISSGQYGIYLSGPSGSADLGTAADPGHNSITNVTLFGLRVGYSTGITVPAVGNSWTPNLQGADGSGLYGSKLVPGPVNNGTPSNYYIDGTGGKIQF